MPPEKCLDCCVKTTSLIFWGPGFVVERIGAAGRPFGIIDTSQPTRMCQVDIVSNNAGLHAAQPFPPLVVIPLLNEQESLPELCKWIEKVMQSHNFSYEILFVDGGSTDQSWNAIFRAFKNKF